MYFLPREAGVDYDPAQKAIGAGPWFLKDYQQSVKATYGRHPGYFDADRFFFDEIEEIVLPEYATRLAQFEAGSIYTAPLTQEDILPAKERNQDLVVYIAEIAPNYGILKWGWNPDLNTPFRDTRLRQALSMSVDRDLILETLFNLGAYADAGIDLQPFVHTSCQADTGADFWLDPRGAEFGPNAKYYEHHADEAKKLVEAAGFGGGLESQMNFTTGYGPNFVNEVTTIIGFAAEVGINLAANEAGFTTNYRPDYANPQGDFDGVTARLRPAGGIFHPVEVAFNEFTPAPGISYTGFFSPDSSWKEGDPEITALIGKARRTLDVDEQRELFHEFQRLEAVNQYQMSFSGVAEQLAIVWPAVANIGVYRGDFNTNRFYGQWLDTTKPPLS
jgi:ABC-type transport system substrate-binding protein